MLTGWLVAHTKALRIMREPVGNDAKMMLFFQKAPKK